MGQDSIMKVIHSGELTYIPASHEDPNNPGVLKRILVGASDVIEGKLQMINWALLRTGKAFQAHYHQDMDEVFIILSGQSRLTVGQESVELKRGDTVVIPAGAVHRMDNIGSEDVEYLVVGISAGKGGKTITLG